MSSRSRDTPAVGRCEAPRSAGRTRGRELAGFEIESSALIELRASSPEEVAAYIAELLLGLRDMARTANHGFLAYLLDMAIDEAEARRDRHM